MKKLLAVAVGLAILFGGIAYASIPDGSGVIHGCYMNSTGRLKVIDSASQTCGTGETALNWNQTGPQGAVGPAGPTGPAGTDALVATYYQVTSTSQVNTSGFSGTFLTACTPGDTITGATDTITSQGGDGFSHLKFIHKRTAQFVQNGTEQGYQTLFYAEPGTVETYGSYSIVTQIVCVHYE